MPQLKPFNLFVYGTLKTPSVFRAVLGKRLVPSPGDADTDAFFPREAVLNGYKKVSPDHTYLYAVPDPQGRIRGLLVGPLPGECLAALRKYEGRNYSRRMLRVQTSDGPQQAIVFVGNLQQMEHSFGYAFHDEFKQEVLLGEKIDAALTEAGHRELHSTEPATRRAVAELHGNTIRDLVRRHFEAGGISDYAIRSLLDRPLPDFSRIAKDPKAKELAPNYLEMVVRQVVFNEFEENIRRDFRFELDGMQRSDTFYERTLSSLAALRMINRASNRMGDTVGRCLRELSFGRDRLVDFVRWAIGAADSLYSARSARNHIRFVANHTGSGYTPLGAELEFSNTGHAVIRDPSGTGTYDATYDGFFYFSDFAMDVLTWKLGGHIDDHRDKAAHRPRRGFFEVALGNLSVEANISKPITDDPWMLNQLIHESRRFYRISPHSVHISLQLRSQHKPVRDRLLPLSILKCLFAVAGDPVRTGRGRCRINRLVSDEISGPDLPVEAADGQGMHLLFSEISRRHSSDGDESHPQIRADRLAGRYVQQFKFLRLTSKLNYEPIIMALKGIQLGLRPGSFLTAAQYCSSTKHRRRTDDLMAWGSLPEPIPAAERKEFLAAVGDGLRTERRGRSAHNSAYIAWSLSQLRAMLKRFNDMLRPAARPRRTPGSSTHAGA